VGAVSPLVAGCGWLWGYRPHILILGCGWYAHLTLLDDSEERMTCYTNHSKTYYTSNEYGRSSLQIKFMTKLRITYNSKTAALTIYMLMCLRVTLRTMWLNAHHGRCLMEKNVGVVIV
jgi:hypothetical protein